MARGDIKAGGAYVLLALKDTFTKDFAKTMATAQRSAAVAGASIGRTLNSGLAAAGNSIRSVGATATQASQAVNNLAGSLSKVGGAAIKLGAIPTAGVVASAREFAKFDDVLREIEASTGVTADELRRIADAAKASEAGATATASAYLELLKAGSDLATVLGGAGEAAIQFAKVSKMQMADAAVVMADAMNVFGESAEAVGNAMSAAADASSTSVALMALSFSQATAVTGLANQSLEDTAAAIAIMANAGVKGSDAGTALRTMFLRLMSPTAEAVTALEGIGLSVDSFRDANGKMLPMADILDRVAAASANLNDNARDNAFRDIFGQDAIRAAAILAKAGPAGFHAMKGAMSGAATIAEKYNKMMGGLSGTMQKLGSAVQLAAIEIGESLAPAMVTIAKALTQVVKRSAEWVRTNGKTVAVVAALSAGLVAAGMALTGVAAALSVAGAILGGIGTLFAAIASPLGIVVAMLAGTGGAWLAFSQDGQAAVSAVGEALKGLIGTAREVFEGIFAALSQGDLALAGEIMAAALDAGFRAGMINLQEATGGAFGEVLTRFGGLVDSMIGVWQWFVDASGSMWDSWGKAIYDTAAAAYEKLRKLWKPMAEQMLKDASVSEADAAVWKGILGVDMHKEGTRASAMTSTARLLNERNLSEAIAKNWGKLNEELAKPEAERSVEEIRSLKKAIAIQTAERDALKANREAIGRGEKGTLGTGRDASLADALASVGQTVSDWDRIREQGGPDAAPMRSMIEEFLAKQTNREGGAAAAARLRELLDRAKAQREAAKAKTAGGAMAKKSALGGIDLLADGGAAAGANIARGLTTFSARGAAAMGFGMQTAGPQEQVVAELKNLAKQQAAAGEVEKAQLREIEAIRLGFVLA